MLYIVKYMLNDMFCRSYWLYYVVVYFYRQFLYIEMLRIFS